MRMEGNEISGEAFVNFDSQFMARGIITFGFNVPATYNRRFRAPLTDTNSRLFE